MKLPDGWSFKSITIYDKGKLIGKQKAKKGKKTVKRKMLRDIGTVPKGLSNVFISLDVLELRSWEKKKAKDENWELIIQYSPSVDHSLIKRKKKKRKGKGKILFPIPDNRHLYIYFLLSLEIFTRIIFFFHSHMI